MKHKRVWTEEQKKAVGDRLKAGREAKLRSTMTAIADHAETEGRVGAEVFGDRMPGDAKYKIRAPEVQAVLDTMTPERKAKLQAIQSRQWQVDAATERATREALARHEAEKSGTAVVETMKGSEVVQTQTIAAQPEPVFVVPPSKPAVTKPVHPFRFTSGGNGLMVSELGACLCGEKKLKWHPVCLVKTHV
jgi:hypothetical protein